MNNDYLRGQFNHGQKEWHSLYISLQNMATDFELGLYQIRRLVLPAICYYRPQTEFGAR